MRITFLLVSEVAAVSGAIFLLMLSEQGELTLRLCTVPIYIARFGFSFWQLLDHLHESGNR